MIVRDELDRLKDNSSPASSEGSSLQRPDSLHGDDDEDRIPDELLLKYTKADDEDDYPVDGDKEFPPNDTTPRSVMSESGKRCQTPDKLPPDDPEETTYVTFVVSKY